MTTLAQRFAQLSLLRPEISQAAIAAACNVKPPSVNDWFSGQTKSLKSSSALKVADLFGVSVQWLTDGKGPMLLAASSTANAPLSQPGSSPSDYTQSAIPALPKSKTGDFFLIKQFDTGGAMGHGVVLQDQPGLIESWRVSHEWLKKNVPHCTSIDNLCIVTGFGDSMLGMFNPGDPILVDRGITTCEFDGVYFFRVGNDGFIKRLQRIPGEGVLVISENSRYRDWTIKPDMDFEVFAKVVKVWKGDSY